MKALIFLNGWYDPEQVDFYQQIAESRSSSDLLVGVDGGSVFLAQIGITPDLLVGDMDSVATEILAKYEAVERLVFACDKDWTDGELAVREAVQRGASEIVLFGGLDRRGETDQMLGNIFLLALAKRLAREKGLALEIRMSDPGQEIFYLENESLEINAQAGDLVSVLPLDDMINIDYQGFAYPKADKTQVRAQFGSSLTLRNELVVSEGRVSVRGRAIVVVNKKCAQS